MNNDRMSREKWQHARNILCIRLDYLGDVLMCTPAMRALKQYAAQRHITLLTSSSGAAVVPYIPEVDALMEYAAPWMKSSAAHASCDDLALAAELRTPRFDAAVIFTSYSQSPLPAAMLCYLADIPLRLAHCHENPYWLLSDWIADPEPQQFVRHEARRQLDLVAETASHTDDERLSFRVPEDDAAWAAQRLDALGIGLSMPWVLLHPGATAASRRYPAELWAETADALAQALDYPLLFTGAKDEIALVESIRDGMHFPSHTLAGELSLGQLAALIARAPVHGVRQYRAGAYRGGDGNAHRRLVCLDQSSAYPVDGAEPRPLP